MVVEYFAIVDLLFGNDIAGTAPAAAAGMVGRWTVVVVDDVAAPDAAGS